MNKIERAVNRIIDNRNTRQGQITIIIILLVLAVLVLTSLWGLQRAGVLGDQSDVVRVVALDGIIMESETAGDITPAGVRTVLSASRGVGAVVLRVNSPGGSVVASQEILALINDFRQETGIPVVISMGESAASGGYYVSLGGDWIVANGGTITGSIGVVSQFLYLDGLYEKLGIATETVTSGEYKSIGSQPLSADERVLLQALSDNIYEQFVREVAQSRGLDIEYVRSIATGEVYSGEQALTLRLVDEIGTLDTAVDRAVALAGIENPRIKIMGQGFFSQLVSSISVASRRVVNVLGGIGSGFRVMWIMN